MKRTEKENKAFARKVKEYIEKSYASDTVTASEIYNEGKKYIGDLFPDEATAEKFLLGAIYYAGREAEKAKAKEKAAKAKAKAERLAKAAERL